MSSFRPWTEKERQEILAEGLLGTSIEDLAILFDRTINAIHNKCPELRTARVGFWAQAKLADDMFSRIIGNRRHDAMAMKPMALARTPKVNTAEIVGLGMTPLYPVCES